MFNAQNQQCSESLFPNNTTCNLPHLTNKHSDVVTTDECKSDSSFTHIVPVQYDIVTFLVTHNQDTKRDRGNYRQS